MVNHKPILFQSPWSDADYGCNCCEHGRRHGLPPPTASLNGALACGEVANRRNLHEANRLRMVRSEHWQRASTRTYRHCQNDPCHPRVPRTTRFTTRQQRPSPRWIACSVPAAPPRRREVAPWASQPTATPPRGSIQGRRGGNKDPPLPSRPPPTTQLSITIAITVRHPRPRHPTDAARSRPIPPSPSAHPAPPHPDPKALSQAEGGRTGAHADAREPHIQRRRARAGPLRKGAGTQDGTTTVTTLLRGL